MQSDETNFDVFRNQESEFVPENKEGPVGIPAAKQKSISKIVVLVLAIISAVLTIVPAYFTYQSVLTLATLPSYERDAWMQQAWLLLLSAALFEFISIGFVFVLPFSFFANITKETNSVGGWFYVAWLALIFFQGLVSILLYYAHFYFRESGFVQIQETQHTKEFGYLDTALNDLYWAFVTAIIIVILNFILVFAISIVDKGLTPKQYEQLKKAPPNFVM